MRCHADVMHFPRECPAEAHLEDGGHGQQEGVEVGVLIALLSASIHV